MGDGLETINVTSLRELLRSGKLRAVDACSFFLDRIARDDSEIGAFCTVDDEMVMREAKDADCALADGSGGALEGVPIAVKDLIFTEGLRTSGGSRLYSDFVPDQDDIAVRRLRAAGAIIIGKTNTAEFGFSANQTANSLFGETRNPLDLSRSPGGSSGGSAAAVSAGFSPAALGSDGGGSVRIPSSFCGLYGLKPTYGRVPVYPSCRDQAYPGLGGWESVEHIGPLTRTVSDAALLLDILNGPDVRDRHSLVPKPERSYHSVVEGDAGDLCGVRVAWSPDWAGSEIVEPAVMSAVETAVRALRDRGCEVTEDAPERPASRDDFGALVALSSDPASMRAELRRGALGVNPRWIAMVEREWTFLELAGAVSARQRMYASVTSFFERYDAFITPTTPFTAMPLGQEGPEKVAGLAIAEPARAVMGFCYPFNMTGHPAASVPYGLDERDLPIGVQVVCGMLRDDLVLLISKALESSAGIY